MLIQIIGGYVIIITIIMFYIRFFLKILKGENGYNPSNPAMAKSLPFPHNARGKRQKIKVLGLIGIFRSFDSLNYNISLWLIRFVYYCLSCMTPLNGEFLEI